MESSSASKVEFDGESFSIDAGLIAEGLGITPVRLRILMRQARITSRCERGVDQDAGKHRLTFFHGLRRLSLIVDEAGNVTNHQLDHVAPGVASR